MTAETFVLVPTDIFDMVADGKISKNAAYLYMVLLGHLNRKRGDTLAWPSRETLAERMRLKKVDGVDPYMNELKAAGLVTSAEHRIGGMRARNRYTLHLIVSLRTPKSGATERAGKTSASAGDDVPPLEGVRYPKPGGLVPPRKGEELDQGFELDEGNPSSSARASPLAYVRDRLGVDDDEGAWIIKTTIGRANGPIRKGHVAYLRSIPDEDYAAMREEYRAACLARASPSGMDIEAARRGAADCEHGTQNGTFVHPVHGTAHCPMCRRVNRTEGAA